MSANSFVNFSIHPSMMKQIFENQAGTLDKGGLEGLQNAKDSGATKIWLEITETYLTITDNGCGMTAQIIHDHYAVFGNSSKAGDDTKAGKFGIGRAQLFPFGKVTVHSLTNKLEIDYRSQLDEIETGERSWEEVGFTHSNVTRSLNGTKVHVQFYEDKVLAKYQITNFISEITTMISFPGIEFYINGQQITFPDLDAKNIVKKGQFCAIPKLDYEDSKLYLKGIFVNKPRGLLKNFHIFADDLEVNTARTAVIESGCYQDYVDFLDHLNVQAIKAWNSNTQFFNDSLLIDLYEKGLVSKKDIMRLKFVNTYEGVNYSLNNLAKKDSKIYNVNNVSYDLRSAANDLVKGNSACDSGAVVKISPKVEAFIQKLLPEKRIEDMSDSGFYSQIQKVVRQNKKVEEVSYADAETSMERKMMKMAKAISHMVAENMGVKKRYIKFVKKSTYLGCTDGVTYINLNFRQIGIYGGRFSAVYRVLKTIVHEYCHDGDSTNASHGLAFYERFHEEMGKMSNIIEQCSSQSLKRLIPQYENWGYC